MPQFAIKDWGLCFLRSLCSFAAIPIGHLSFVLCFPRPLP
jgi:hypothetical protein